MVGVATPTPLSYSQLDLRAVELLVPSLLTGVCMSVGVGRISKSIVLSTGQPLLGVRDWNWLNEIWCRK